MKPTTTVPPEVRSLIETACDGMADDAQVRNLESVLLTNEEARNFYVDLVDLDAKLRWLVGSLQQGDVAVKEFIAAEQPPPQQPAPGFPGSLWRGSVGCFSSGWPLAYLIASVIFGIGLVIGAFTYVSEPAHVVQHSPTLPSPLSTLPSTVGRITGMVDCQLEEGSGLGARGSGLGGQGSELPSPAGRGAGGEGGPSPESRVPSPRSLVSLGDQFHLASGLLEITYDTGAKVILQGPVAYEVESRDGGYLSIGRLTARLEKKAEGGRRKAEEFTNPKSEISNPQSLIPTPSSPAPRLPPPAPLFVVRTPTAVVTDLGTEFGVEVGPKGTTETQVFVGEVSIAPAGKVAYVGQSPRIVRAGEVARVDGEEGRPLVVGRAEPLANRFVREILAPKRGRRDVLYREVFGCAAQAYSKTPIAETGWKFHYGDKATSFDVARSEGDAPWMLANASEEGKSAYLEPVDSHPANGEIVRGWIYLSARRTANNDASILWTDEVAGLGIASDDLTEISWYQADGDAAHRAKTNRRLALKVAGNWYFSDATYSQQVIDGIRSATRQSCADFSRACWYRASFVPGGQLSCDTTGAKTRLPRGPLQAIGFYKASPKGDGSNIGLRIDTVEIVGVHSPRRTVAYADLVLSLNPVAYYRMERPRGGDPNVLWDSSPGAHHAEMRFSPEFGSPWERGPLGGALFFHGPEVRDYAVVRQWPKATDRVSVSAWVMAMRHWSRAVIVSSCGRWGAPASEGAGQFSLGLGGGWDANLVAHVRDRQARKIYAAEDPKRPLPLHSWQHVAFVFDKNVLRLYRNGAEVASAQADGLLSWPAVDTLGIGGIEAADDAELTPSDRRRDFWHGRIAQLAVFYSALSPDDIRSLYWGRRQESPKAEGGSKN